jgi:hypothetical protein
MARFYGVFGCVERKWKERKLRKSMDEFELILCPSSSIDFRNFPSFHFLSFKPNTALVFLTWEFGSHSGHHSLYGLNDKQHRTWSLNQGTVHCPTTFKLHPVFYFIFNFYFIYFSISFLSNNLEIYLNF